VEEFREFYMEFDTIQWSSRTRTHLKV